MSYPSPDTIEAVSSNPEEWSSPSPDHDDGRRSSSNDDFSAMAAHISLEEQDEDEDLEAGSSSSGVKAKRAQGPRGSSCSLCRRGKRKCDEGRPCRRCEAKGPEAAAACAKEVPRKEHVHRPEKYRQKKISCASAANAFAQPIHTQIPHRMLAVGLAHTTNPKEWIDIFNHLPPKLHATALEILDVLWEQMLGQGASFTPSPSPENDAAAASQASDAKRSAANKWAESARCGFISLDYNPNSGQRDCVSVNGYGAVSLFGMHREEALARLAQDELKLPTTQLRAFCLLFDGLLQSPENMKRSRYLCSTGRTGEKGGVLIRSQNKMEIENNKMTSFTSTFTLLSADEYDRAIGLQPEVGETLVAAARGRHLTGREIMESDTLVAEERFETLCGSEEGRRGLDNLADELSKRFLPSSSTAASVASPA
eukprot:CAMPEP_0181319940 /NCGR_PEP_ID=MMETSP1101-20121128/17847_1 /TAXON_ID=46948 /ORGANISM="Rhodomonas abbreviata, Strain Caron Lab Isolate" /LENGTH=424 /DNA_ID=CAMNT_0023427589 /DNA_START=174 /DNA_END=1443 /DNA_ORIENTATION=+